MLTRSKKQIFEGQEQASPSTSGILVAGEKEDDQVSQSTKRSTSTHSSATVRARKAAVEARLRHEHCRREEERAARLKREQQECEKQLAAMRNAVLEKEVEAELAAIDAEVEGSQRAASVSENRTEQWVCDNLDNSIVYRDFSVAERGHLDVAHPDRPVSPPAATRASASLYQPQNVNENIAVGRNLTVGASPGRSVSPLPITGEPAIPVLCDQTFDKLPDQPIPPPMTTQSIHCQERQRVMQVEPVNNAILLQAIADTAAATKALALTKAHHKTSDLVPFSGDPLQWLYFKRIYDATKINFSPLDNLIRLQSAVHGPAREAVAALLLTTTDPEEVVTALEDNFARPELVVFNEMASLRSLPRLGNDMKELVTLANRVRNSLSIIRLLNHVEYLHSPELFHAVLAKLNTTMKLRWTDFAAQDTTRRAKLEILGEFLKQELDKFHRFGLSPESVVLQRPLALPGTSAFRREHINALTQGGDAKQLCAFCKKNHKVTTCEEFKALSVDNRWRWLREARACYRCLKNTAHTWKSCNAKPCSVDGCRFRHHTLLHGSQSPTVPTTSPEGQNLCAYTVMEEQDPCVTISTTSTQQYSTPNAITTGSQVLLKTIPVTVSGPSGTYDTYALLDDGSTATLIDANVAAHIGATGPQETITVRGVGGLTRNTTINKVSFYIKGKHSNETFLVENARAMHSLALPTQSIGKHEIASFSHLSGLIDDNITYVNATPTVLIGADHWYLSVSRETREGGRNKPVGCLTALGWTLYGHTFSKTQKVSFVNHTRICDDGDLTQQNCLESLIKQQYRLDSIGISKLDSLDTKEEKRAIEILEATSKRLPDGRFEVGLPWRDDTVEVPDSYPQALSRFLSLERRMRKDSDFGSAYTKFIGNMVEKGYAEECASETYYAQRNSAQTSSSDKNNAVRLYLPHFGVYHPQKRKLRVVHDAAAMNMGISLNSLLLPGPDLLQPMLGILFRFREGRIAVTADIKEMFPQIRVRQEDRDALRYLWRDPQLSKGIDVHPIKEYRMTAVLFGASCSPFIAQFIKNKNAREYEPLYPRATEAILNSHYMDDYLDSLDNISEAAQLAADVVTVHGAACFEMRGWLSNEPDALASVPTELRAVQMLHIDLGNPPNGIGVLGVAWNPAADSLGFRTGADCEAPLTKRKVLSHLMRVYDPLGMLAPIVVKGRILFQQAWRSNVGWDDVLPPSEVAKWHEWYRELSSVSSLSVPRWYAQTKGEEPLRRELHVFADASEHAYACVAYWRLVYNDNEVQLVLISSKARVAPLKPISIPRLELQGALIASRLATTISDAHRKKPSQTFFWTDSLTVLGWLRSDGRMFKPFVAHRVGEITEVSNVRDWRWVPTHLNVADDATRSRPIVLEANSRWFNGPSFLLQDAKYWPVEKEVTPVREDLKTRGELVGLLQATIIVSPLPTPVTADLSYFSNWLRVVRATARVHQAAAKFGEILARFRNCKLNHVKKNPKTLATTTLAPLSADLIGVAEQHILQKTQLHCFTPEFKRLLQDEPIPVSSRLKNLSVTVGKDNLLRLTGRIKAVEGVEEDVKSPVILDGSHPTIRLLVLHYHQKAGHANNEYVINDLRQRFWLLRLRNTVRSVVRSCPICRILKALPTKPVMGDLPLERLDHHRRAFTNTGLDYFGPMTITVGRRHEKRFVALFTCLTTRAVHLELVHSLTTDAAIMAIRRFVARRGTPATIISDNGTAFVGANRALKAFHSEAVEEFVAHKGIHWKFIPARAPSFGGCWERLVRTVKVALKASLKERSPKEEVLATLLAEAEAIVSSRPLSHVSVDPDVTEGSLTPFHFLIGGPTEQALPAPLSDTALAGRLDWKKALRLADHFWSRWVREILPVLQSRQPGGKNRSVNVGDVVLVADDQLPRGVWPRGRIEATFPGRDGVVRVVDVKTAGGTLRRPVRKLIFLI